MSSVDLSNQKFRAMAEAARRILDVYGHAAPDTIRTVYADGDLNIGSEEGVVEIIYRGTLVFRYAPEGDTQEQVFQDEGGWRDVVERIAQDAATAEAVAGGPTDDV
ncbi:MAG TPA: hypothetical protein VGX92_20620 [Pyrinomonadaceae bacterium]|jgi:hypothetical protein|nr:hypothetical protein [Pyrinomonadaceae bacterium]